MQLLWLGERMEIPAPAGLAVAEGMVARVQLFGDAAIFAPLEEMRLSRLLRLSDSECEGELEGNLPLKAPLSVYLVEREPAYRAEQGSLQDLVVGMSDLVLYLSEGGVAAAKVEKGPTCRGPFGCCCGRTCTSFPRSLFSTGRSA